MKVKRLIEVLKMMNPEAECYIECADSNVVQEIGQFESKIHSPYPVPVVYISDSLFNLREKDTTRAYLTEEISYHESIEAGKKRDLL